MRGFSWIFGSFSDTPWSDIGVTLVAAFACRGHRFVRVLHEPLRPTDRARHVEASVEVAEVLGRLERFLERRLRETQCRGEALELTRVYVRHARIIPPYAHRHERTEAHPARLADPPVLRRCCSR